MDLWGRERPVAVGKSSLMSAVATAAEILAAAEAGIGSRGSVQVVSR